MYGEMNSHNDRVANILRNWKAPGTAAFEDWITGIGKVAVYEECHIGNVIVQKNID